jgi:hypothetical protein
MQLEGGLKGTHAFMLLWDGELQNYVYEYFLHMFVLVIDCYWCGFGGIQDRVDLRIPPI